MVLGMFESRREYLDYIFRAQRSGMNLIRSLVDQESYENEILREFNRKQFNLELILKIFFDEDVIFDLHWIIPRLSEKEYIHDLLHILEYGSLDIFWESRVINYILEEGNICELNDLSEISIPKEYKEKALAKCVILKLAGEE